MPTRSILERITAGDILVMDGGTGSELQKRGVDMLRGTSVEGRRMGPEKYGWTTGHGVWSATATLEAPDVVRHTSRAPQERRAEGRHARSRPQLPARYVHRRQ